MFKNDKYLKEAMLRKDAKIGSLENEVASLAKKLDDASPNSEMDGLKNELLFCVEELRACRKEYEKLFKELVDMRNAMDEIVYNGKWKFLKWFLR